MSIFNLNLTGRGKVADVEDENAPEDDLKRDVDGFDLIWNDADEVEFYLSPETGMEKFWPRYGFTEDALKARLRELRGVPIEVEQETREWVDPNVIPLHGERMLEIELGRRWARRRADEQEREAAGVADAWDGYELGEYLDDQAEDERPTVGTLPGGRALFYQEAINGVAGEPAGGKSWLAMLAVVQEMKSGNPVVYVDLEDTPRRVVKRLYALGATRDEIMGLLRYVRPLAPFSEAYRASVDSMLRDVRLVVIDSTGEALALNGVKPNADEEVAAWFQILPHHIANQGPAVVLLDHVAKAEGGRWPIGSQRKLAAITGAQYTLTNVESFARGKSGYSELVVSKDRHGYRYVGEKAALLEVEAEGGETVAFRMIEDDGRISVDNTNGPTQGARILTAMTGEARPLSNSEISVLTSIDQSDVRKRMKELEADQKVVFSHIGEKNSKFWALALTPGG